jgi:hypothetical protein
MTIYRRTPGVSETVVEDDLFLVSPQTQDIVHLDRLAAALWRLLAEPQSRTDIAAVFAAAFPDAAPAGLAADLDAALAALAAAGLVLAEGV